MLTPIDIQNHSLKTAVRGYSKKETDDFLEEILQGYESLYKENRELKDKVTSLSEGVQYYKQMETTLQKALVLAEKTSTETQAAAKSKADALTNEAQAKAEAMLTEAQTKANSILTEAQTKADSLLKEAQAETDGIRKEIHAYSDITKAKANRELEETRNHVRKLVQSYETYRLQFKKLAESQIEMLESENYSIFVPELTEMLDDAPDADTAMETQKTVAINLKSSEQIASEIAMTVPEADHLVSETVSKEPEALSEAAAGQERTIEKLIAEQPVIHTVDSISEQSTGQKPVSATDIAGQAVYTADAVPATIENTPQNIHANDIVPGSIGNIQQEIHANNVIPDSAVGNTNQEIRANDVVPGNIGNAEQEIRANDVVPGNIGNTGQEIHANDVVPGIVENAGQAIQMNDVVASNAEQEIHTNDIAGQAIRATDIVPGNPAALTTENVVKTQPAYPTVTPKLEGYEGAVTKTVMPNTDSPFTFIDTE